MKRTLRIVRRYWVAIFVAFCAIYLLVNERNLQQFGSLARPESPHLLLVAFLFQFCVWLLLAAGWKSVIEERTKHSYSLTAAFAHLAIFSIGKYLPGKVWGVAARAARMSRQGISAKASIESTAHEQFLVLHSASILIAVMLPLIIDGWLPWALAAFAVATVAIGGQLVHLALPLLFGLFGHASQAPTRLAPLAATRMVAYYLAAWAFHGAVLAAVYASFFGDLDSLTLRTTGLFLLANTVGMVAGFAALFAPAGLGAREAAMVGILSLGMPLQDAIALSVAMRAWTVVADVALSGMLPFTASDH